MQTQLVARMLEAMQLDSERIKVELRVLAICLVNPQRLDAIVSRVQASDFFFPSHWRAIDLLMTLRDAGQPIEDFTGIALHELKKAGIVTEDAQPDSIAESALIEARLGAVDVNVERYVDQIVAFGQQAELELLSRNTVAKLSDRGAKPAEVAAEMQAKIETLVARQRFETKTLGEHAMSLVSETRKLMETEGVDRPRGLSTGILSVDVKIGGFVPGELVILAARPSAGKTSIAMQILRHNVADNRRVLFLSFEMKGQELAQREIIAGLGGTLSQQQMRSSITREQFNEMARVAVDLSDCNLHIFDADRFGLKQVRALAKRFDSSGGLDMLAIDYLQIMKPANRMAPTNEQIRDNAIGLKLLARELGIPILCLAQLNRQADGATPKMSHIKGCGEVEQEADVVLLLDNPKPDSAENEARAAKLIIGKARNVDTGTIGLRWHPTITTFTDGEEIPD